MPRALRSSMAQRLDPIVKQFRAANRRALFRLGKEAQTELRKMVGIRVGRTHYGVIRSNPGEPPRRETGEYQQSLKYRVLPGAETVDDLSIYSSDIRSLWFEGGTKHMAKRPHFAVLIRRFGLRKKYKQYLKEELGK